MQQTIWAHDGKTYRLVKVTGGYDIFLVGVGWVGWSAGGVKDAKDSVRSWPK